MNKPLIGGLIIAAGFSSRMERLKPLIVFKGKSFLVHVIIKMTRVCSHVVIVTGHASDTIKSTTNDWLKKQDPLIQSKIDWHYNPNYEKGMTTSLQYGIQHLTGHDWILYHFADQPHIPRTFYKKFTSQIVDDYNWIQPEFNKKSGHPILISGSLIQPILQLKTDESLKDLTEKVDVKIKKWPVSDIEINQDFNTPKQLNNLGVIR